MEWLIHQASKERYRFEFFGVGKIYSKAECLPFSPSAVVTLGHAEKSGSISSIPMKGGSCASGFYYSTGQGR